MSDAGRAAARVDCENVFSPERATPAGAEALQSFLHIATPAMAHMMSKATYRVVSCSPLPVSSSTASHTQAALSLLGAARARTPSVPDDIKTAYAFIFLN
eukprot:5508524-Pleurochrysis_carterae.AAC.1